MLFNNLSFVGGPMAPNTVDTGISLGTDKMPHAASYYQELQYSQTVGVAAPGSYTNTTITDSIFLDGTYIHTGYAINTTDNTRTLFVLKTDGDGNVLDSFYWRNNTAYTLATGGLAIAVNQSNNEIYVGGFLNYDKKGGTSSRFETYGIGVLLCIDLSTLNLKWNITYGHSSGFEFGDTSASYYDFGGERIEDVVALPDGNIAITGAEYYYSAALAREGVSVFIASIDRSNGNIIWSFQSHYIGDDANHPTPSVGKKMIYRSSANELVVLNWNRTGNKAGDFYYSINPCLIKVDTDDGSVDYTSSYIVFNGAVLDPENTNYKRVNDITLSPQQDYFWAGGYQHIQTTGEENFTNIPMMWEIYALDGETTTRQMPSFGNVNRTINFIYCETQNDTLYIAGEMVDNSTNERATWVSIIDMDTSTIISTALEATDPSLSDQYFGIAIGDFLDNITIIRCNPETTDFQSDMVTYVGAVPSQPEQLDQLPQYSVDIINLTWSSLYSDIKYFLIYRNYTTIDGTPTDLTNFTRIAELESQYYYVDSDANKDGQIYWYALVCANDRGNATTIQFTKTQFYKSLAAPIVRLVEPSISPDIVLLGGHINLTWQDIEDDEARIYIYWDNSPFTHDDLGSVNLINISATNISYSFLPNYTGEYYFLVQAYNPKRGDPKDTGTLLQVHVQDIAKPPTNVHAYTTEEKERDGYILISWDSFPSTTYYIYGKVNENFTYNDIYNKSKNVELIATYYAVGSHVDTQIQVSLMGTWYFRILAVNSSGTALNLSETVEVTVHIIPQQPNIYLVSANPHTDDIVQLKWDNDSNAKFFLLYRVEGSAMGDAKDLENPNARVLIYNGTTLGYYDSEPKDHTKIYFYAVIAANEYGYREIDITTGKYVYASFVAEVGSGIDKYLGLIIGLAVIGVASLGWYIHKKRNPWAGI